MSKLDDALKRFEQVATLGMRESDYMQVSDSLAWFREDLTVVKKSVELLELYQKMYDTPLGYKELRKQIGMILQLEKELGEMK